MFLLVPAHLGCPGEISQSRKMVVCVCVCVCVCMCKFHHLLVHKTHQEIQMVNIQMFVCSYGSNSHISLNGDGSKGNVSSVSTSTTPVPNCWRSFFISSCSPKQQSRDHCENSNKTKIQLTAVKPREIQLLNIKTTYLSSLNSDYVPSRSLRSSDKLPLSHPYTSLVMANKALSVSASNI